MAFPLSSAPCIVAAAIGFSGSRPIGSRPARVAWIASSSAPPGPALYRKSPLDRHWRDISTISQHAFANEKGYAEVGRAMLSLDPASLMI